MVIVAVQKHALVIKTWPQVIGLNSGISAAAADQDLFQGPGWLYFGV